MSATRPIQRTSVNDAQPWALTLRSRRQVRCPVCGIPLPGKAGFVAGQVLVCDPCVRTNPRGVTQAVCICFVQCTSDWWTFQQGVYLYTPKPGHKQDVRSAAVAAGRWPATDQPCNYPPYVPDWPRHLSAALDQCSPESSPPDDPDSFHRVCHPVPPIAGMERSA